MERRRERTAVRSSRVVSTDDVDDELCRLPICCAPQLRLLRIVEELLKEHKSKHGHDGARGGYKRLTNHFVSLLK